MTPQEFTRIWKEVRPPPQYPKPLPISRITKDALMDAARHADPPWTKEEIKAVMEALGLRPGYD
jgi:hypothetical protein